MLGVAPSELGNVIGRWKKYWQETFKTTVHGNRSRRSRGGGGSGRSGRIPACARKRADRNVNADNCNRKYHWECASRRAGVELRGATIPNPRFANQPNPDGRRRRTRCGELGTARSARCRAAGRQGRRPREATQYQCPGGFLRSSEQQITRTAGSRSRQGQCDSRPGEVVPREG